MQHNLLEQFGNSHQRVIAAIESFKQGNGILVLDDENRENEGDLIFPAETIQTKQMAHLIRYGSGIVCLCLEDEFIQRLDLAPMVKNNTSVNQTAFTVTIEAAKGVSTGVSAADRVCTIKTAVDFNAKPSDLNRPGHIFPLACHKGGILARQGHTEASVAFAKLAGHRAAAVICELTNEDGSMSRMPQVMEFGLKFGYPVVTIADLLSYLEQQKITV